MRRSSKIPRGKGGGTVIVALFALLALGSWTLTEFSSPASPAPLSSGNACFGLGYGQIDPGQLICPNAVTCDCTKGSYPLGVVTLWYCKCVGTSDEDPRNQSGWDCGFVARASDYGTTSECLNGDDCDETETCEAQITPTNVYCNCQEAP
mgnify:CR=1 FL=1